jgi:hypothetical protein
MIAATDQITATWRQMRYHPEQSALWRYNGRFAAVYAGRGSGKTELARRRVIRFLQVRKPWSDPIYFYALPTYNQARRVAWPQLKALTPKRWMAGEPSESELSISTIYGSKLYVVGMDKPARIEGNQWDGGVIDESSDQKPKSFDLSVRPALTWREGWCWRIGVPKRTGSGAADFKEFCMRGHSENDYGLKSFTWSSEDILSEYECRIARDSMDEKDYNEQFRASWESVSGLIFYAFSDITNVSPVQYHEDLPLIVGCDFNVDPMAWIVGQVVNEEFHVLDELFIRNTNTPATLEELARRYKTHKAGFRFYGDASGRARKTSATETDYIQIRNYDKLEDSRVFFPLANPSRADRFAACNALFCNANGRRRCKIHPRCKNLIKDLTTRAYKQGENEPEDGGDVGHMTDAFGYPVYLIFPLTIKIMSTPEVWTQ